MLDFIKIEIKVLFPYLICFIAYLQVESSRDLNNKYELYVQEILSISMQQIAVSQISDYISFFVNMVCLKSDFKLKNYRKKTNVMRSANPDNPKKIFCVLDTRY